MLANLERLLKLQRWKRKNSLAETPVEAMLLQFLLHQPLLKPFHRAHLAEILLRGKDTSLQKALLGKEQRYLHFVLRNKQQKRPTRGLSQKKKPLAPTEMDLLPILNLSYLY